MASKKEIKRLVEAAAHWPGWRIEATKSGWMLYPPDKSQTGVLIHGTESDWRAWANTISRLRNRGAPI